MGTSVNPGWVLTVLSDRGFMLPDRDVLRDALKDVDDDLRQKLNDALTTIARGGDDEAKMELAGTLGRALSARVRASFKELAAPYHPAAVLRWALATPEWSALLQKAAAGDQSAKDDLIRSTSPSEEAVTMDDRHEGSNVESEAEVPGRTQRASPPQSAPATTRNQSNGTVMTAEARPEQSERPPRTHHVYGAKGALAIELDVARAREGSDRPFTLRIEGARAAGEAGGGAMRYDWERKLVFQLTHRELHQAAAVLIGASPRCEFNAHGDNRDKRCEIVAQSGGVFVKLSQGKHAVAVPVGADDLFDVALLAVRALAQNDPDIDQGVLLDILRLTTKVTSRG